MASDYTPVRLSHLLRNCAVGAIVRGPDYLMVVADSSQWTSRDGQAAGKQLHFVDQVRSTLGIPQSLREPPVAQQGPDGRVQGSSIPASRFPGWMRCPACGLLHYKPWQHCPAGEQPRCSNTSTCKDRALLEQVQWVLVHAEGYLAEVPWHFLTHRDNRKGSSCKASWAESFLFLVSKSGGQQSLRCRKCGATAHLQSGTRVNFGSARQQPWYQVPAPELEEPASVLAINDARLHTPETKTALVIPPESRIHQRTVVGQLYTSSEKLRRLQVAVQPLHRKAERQRIAKELNCMPAEIDDALTEIDKGFPLYGEKISQGDLFETEYQALIEPIPDISDDEDFVTHHHTRAWKKLHTELPPGDPLHRLLDSVDRLIEVRRLKEVMVLKGFRRLDGRNLIPPDLTGDLDWLPALELYGEGLFFTFNSEILRQHAALPELEKRVQSAGDKIERHDLSFNNPPSMTAQFIFLHTLSHLLIRQLENSIGYPASSLSERIYCSPASVKEPGPEGATDESSNGHDQENAPMNAPMNAAGMAGILIYVAVPDVVGSLGGLAEMAQPQRFLPLLASAFDQAQWCSIDPVCSEHTGQGPGQINRAACHACTLLPETSCDYGNLLLDRTFVKGDIKAHIPSFMDG